MRQDGYCSGKDQMPRPRRNFSRKSASASARGTPVVTVQALIAESAQNHDNRRQSTRIRADPHLEAADPKALQIAHSQS